MTGTKLASARLDGFEGAGPSLRATSWIHRRPTLPARARAFVPRPLRVCRRIRRTASRSRLSPLLFCNPRRRRHARRAEPRPRVGHGKAASGTRGSLARSLRVHRWPVGYQQSRAGEREITRPRRRRSVPDLRSCTWVGRPTRSVSCAPTTGEQRRMRRIAGNHDYRAARRRPLFGESFHHSDGALSRASHIFWSINRRAR